MAKPIEDLRIKSDDELEGQLADLKREQFNLRFQSATNQLEKPARVTDAPLEPLRLRGATLLRATQCPSAVVQGPLFQEEQPLCHSVTRQPQKVYCLS